MRARNSEHMEGAGTCKGLIERAGNLTVIAEENGVQNTDLFGLIGDAIGKDFACPGSALEAFLNQWVAFLASKKLSFLG